MRVALVVIEEPPSIRPDVHGRLFRDPGGLRGEWRTFPDMLPEYALVVMCAGVTFPLFTYPAEQPQVIYRQDAYKLTWLGKGPKHPPRTWLGHFNDCVWRNFPLYLRASWSEAEREGILPFLSWLREGLHAVR